MSIDYMRVTYADYCVAVHQNYRLGTNSWSLSETFVNLLKQVRPQLYASAVTHIDPAEPPYRIKEFLDLVKENWDTKLAPKK